MGDEEDALRQQLESLENQLTQLSALLVDGDTQSPLVQLKEELQATIDGIRQRLPIQPVAGHAEVDDDTDGFTVGDICLAPRIFDRRRARAIVREVDDSKGTCLVTWVYPRQRREITCRYWKEGSCKFSGPDCPFSHGVGLSLADLLPDSSRLGCKAAATDQADERGGESSVTETDEAVEWLASLSVGSRVLARYHDGVWYQGKVVAEPDSVPPSPSAETTEAAKAGSMSVQFDGFEDEGNVCVSADTSNLAPLNECGEVDSTAAGGTTRTTGGGGSAASASDSGDESSELEDAWADAPDLVGPDEVFFRERVLGGRGEGGRSRDGAGGGREGGPRDEVYVVGDWEQHTKGFGSRMMSRMGYRRGEGLGKEKQGIARPVSIRVLPERCSLDHLRDEHGSLPKPNSGGGTRIKKRKKKSSAAAAAAAADKAEPQKAMFDFLNVTIHASAKGSAGAGGGGGGSAAAAGFGANVASSSSSRGSGRPSLVNRRPIFDMRKKSAASPSSGPGSGGAGAASNGGRAGEKMSKSELRAHLVNAREAEVALAGKVVRLEETVTRNSERDPRVAAQARQKLEEVRAQVREVRASRGKAERMLGDREDRGKGSGKGGLFAF